MSGPGIRVMARPMHPFGRQDVAQGRVIGAGRRTKAMYDRRARKCGCNGNLQRDV